MTLVQLRHLISLAQTGSFSQSASALFLTQPALSRSIRALEAELGQPLFDRVGRRSELTPFGRDALDRARELVLAAEDLRERARLSGDSQAGLLRVGLGSGPGAMLMTPLLLKVAQDRPRLRVQIARASTAMKTYSIATIPGDGIGKEVFPAGQQVLEALANGRASTFRFEFENFGWGGDYYREHGVMMPADGLDAHPPQGRDPVRLGRRPAHPRPHHAVGPAPEDLPGLRPVRQRAAHAHPAGHRRAR
jgi:DNA-binding MarR family transcriptional regulator